MKNRTMGRITAALIALVLVGGIAMTWYARGRWWFPPLASAVTGQLDQMFNVMLIVIGIVFVVVHVFLAYVLYRFVMDPKRKGFYSHENARLELTWTVLTALILLWFLVLGSNIWAGMQIHPATSAAAGQGADHLEIEVIGRQFAWFIRYPGPDGRLGEAAPRFISAENPLGINLDDPQSADDIVVVNHLVLPVGEKVRLQLRAVDVIHSFFLPHFRVKMDSVPGRVTELWLEPSEKGEYEAVCAELCGAGHYVMRSRVSVVDMDEYTSWLAEQARDAGWR